ncbi:MAG TPA: LptF/LptG family permease [Methylomirabilota bacterium]|nr:LptF/LptG family permease [Methylomirabilota bacterium]
MPFRVIDRYVYRELLPIFSLAVGIVTFLHVMDRLQDFSNMIVNGAPFGLVFRTWALLLLSFMSHTLPMGLLLAIVIAAGRLASDLEVVALSAGGVSPLRLFRPFLVAALVVTTLMALLTMWINPWGATAFFQCLRELRAHVAAPMIEERTFTRIGNVIIYAEQMDLATSELRRVLIANERDADSLQIITAPRARMIDDAGRQRTVLKMTDGAIHESRPESPDWYRVTRFEDYETSLDVSSQVEEVEKKMGPQKRLTAWDLLQNTRALDASRRADEAQTFVLEFHKRLAYPLAPIVFAMVAFPLGIRLHRGGRAVAAVGGIIVYLVYHVSQEGLGRVTALKSWGGGRWIPIMGFALVGAVLLYFTVRPTPRVWRHAWDRLADLVPTRLPVLRRRSPAGVRRREIRRRHLSSLVDRYLARQFAVYFAYGLAVATAIFIVVDLVEVLSRYEPPLHAVLEHFAYRLPSALHQALPIVVLVATVFLFMELERHHELTALKAAGLSLHRVSVPVLILAGAVSVAAFVYQETAAPVLNAKGDEVDRVEIRKVSAPGSQPRLQWYRRSDSEFVRVDRLDRTLGQVSGVTLVQTDANFRVAKRVDAAEAAWTRNGLRFGRSVLREFGPDNSVRTERQNGAPVYLADSLDALGAVQAPSAMTFLELRSYVRHLRERGQAVGTQLLYLHSKLSFPLMSFVLAILAISCAARWPRGGRLIGGAIAMIISVAFWVVNSGALSLGRVDLLPPVVAAWAANIVFGGIGVSLFVRTPT